MKIISSKKKKRLFAPNLSVEWKEKLNKKTDCWRCRQTFGESKIIYYLFGRPISFGTVLAYEQHDILCTDCMDLEIEEQSNNKERGEIAF